MIGNINQLHAGFGRINNLLGLFQTARKQLKANLDQYRKLASLQRGRFSIII